ncbi:MAG: signal peptidase II [Balneolaceae bacterium]
MTERTRKLRLLFVPVFGVLVLDQLSKHWVRYSLELHHLEIIEGWLQFNYTQNPGMAMGMEFFPTPVISGVAILATIAIFVYLFRNLENSTTAYLICMGSILGGALGNITDRLTMGYIEGHGGILDGHVIDFIHFNLELWDRPVFPYIFNVADIAITTSIIVMLLFHNRIMPTPEPDTEPETTPASNS